MAAFPAYPKLLFQGFTEKPEPAIKRSDAESGPAKQLKTKSRVLVKRSVSYLLASAADRDSFMTWFKVTINFGADWFDWIDPYDNATKPARIVGGDIDPKPQRKMLDRWTVDFQIETWSA